MPAGPVPPMTAIGRMGAAGFTLMRIQPRAILRLCTLVHRQLDLDAGVCRVALGRDAAHLKNQRLKVFRAGVLAGGGSGFARNVFFHQSSAVVVGSGVQAELREVAVQLYPRDLNVVDGVGEQQSGESVNFEMLGKRRAGACESLMEEQRVLMNEAEGNELGEASGLGLNVAQAGASVEPSGQESRNVRT